MKVGGVYVYKCRRCGREFAVPKFRSGDLEDSLLSLARAKHIIEHTPIIHHCDGQQLGIADLVGGDIED
jgi:hypothetical protein